MSDAKQRPLLRTVLFGTASAVLYVLLFLYADNLVDWARRTQTGEKMLFIVPVVVAFVFSYFHGAFTGYFWESIGLRAAASKK